MKIVSDLVDIDSTQVNFTGNIDFTNATTFGLKVVAKFG